MSKELEKIENALKDLNELGELYLSTHTRQIKYTKGFDTLKDVLGDYKQALTPPTQEEVCKVLSEYLEEKVWFENGCFYIGTYNENEAVIYLFDDDVHFSVVLSPKIVVLIGRFYEGVTGNE